MKPAPEDTRPTAYVLGELGAEEATTIEQAAARDPALEAEINELQSIQQFLTDRLALPAETLLPRQRENIRRSACEADRAGKSVSFGTWLIPASAAAILALATLILIRRPGEKPTPVAVHPTTPAVIAPVPVAPPPPAPALSLPVPHGPIVAADFPILDLPILTDKGNLETIAKSIRIDQQLPPPSSVRLEEILNAFPLRLHGVTAISRTAANNWHPDTRESGMSPHVATLSTEMIPCPWKPSATLLLVSLRGNARDASNVRISYHANPANVTRYRLLGFTPAAGQATANLPVKLAANSMTNIAIQIEAATPGGDLGSLVWTADDKAAPSISLAHKKDAEPSDDARFGALVCTYALWLTGEDSETIEPDNISALAREIASPALQADRADFLNLIDKSLRLQRQ